MRPKNYLIRLLKVLPSFLIVLSGFISCPAFAADDPEMRKQVSKMWAAEDFQGLEKTAEECRQTKMDVLDRFPRLGYFYATIRGADIASDEDATLKQQKIERWLATKPDSITALVALADFHITNAWRARGGNWANEVPSENWKIFKNRLAKAQDVLYSPGMKIQADPSIAGMRIILTMAGDDSHTLRDNFEEGTKWWPEYYPIYDGMARALLPRWGGLPTDGAQFATRAADRLTGGKADGLYAMIACTILEPEGVKFFTESGFDPARHLRGLDILVAEGESSYRPFSTQRAAFVEAMSGDPETARRRIFSIGPNTIPSSYLSYDQVFTAWEKCGAMNELLKGISLEGKNMLEEAEAHYVALTTSDSNPWLEAFALRNGISRLWKPRYGSPSPDFAPEKADPNQLFELTFFHLCAGNLDKAHTYAEAFDTKRGFNITGKYTLICIAALHGDLKALEHLKKNFLALKTGRMNYRLAQDFVSGKSGWKDIYPQMPQDGFFSQACALMASFALGEGRPQEAREIFETVHRLMPLQPASAFAESMLWGSLHRRFPHALSQ